MRFSMFKSHGIVYTKTETGRTHRVYPTCNIHREGCLWWAVKGSVHSRWAWPLPSSKGWNVLQDAVLDHIVIDENQHIKTQMKISFWVTYFKRWMLRSPVGAKARSKWCSGLPCRYHNVAMAAYKRRKSIMDITGTSNRKNNCLRLGASGYHDGCICWCPMIE